MRVSHSLSSAGIGLALLATFGFAGQSKQPQQGVAKPTQLGVRPSEKITVPATTFTWDELMAIQASLPKDMVVVEQALISTPETAPMLATKEGVAQATTNPNGGQENMALCVGAAVEPPLGKKYDSQLDGPDGAGFSFIPPDVTGGVGPAHHMTMLNNKTLVQNRDTAAVLTIDTSVFWSPLGATPLSPTNTFHRLYYDNIDGRWIASCKNGPVATGSIFFAISATNDPTGVWNYYSFSAGAGVQLADWIVTGSNQTWIAIGADMFNSTGATFLGHKLWAIDKTTALAGGPLTVSIFATAYPATVTGTGGATGASRWFVSRAYDNSDPDIYIVACSSFIFGAPDFLMQVIRLTGTGPLPTVVPGGPSLFAPAGTASLFEIAPGVSFASQLLSMFQSGDVRRMSGFSVRAAEAVVRNGRLWVANNGGLPGPQPNAAPTSAGVNWFEVNMGAMPTPIVQSGMITGGAGTASYYPSIAVNCGNDVLIGFSNGDSSRFARSCYTFRLGTDPLNFMGPIRELKAGESSYWKNFGVGSTTICTWGRYSASSVDPLNDRALWTLQQYADTRVGPLDNDSRWGTHWGRVGDCGNPTITNDPDPLTVCVTDPASFSVGATPSAGTLFTYQWRKDGVDIGGATASSYTIPSTTAFDGGTYDVIVTDACGSSTSLGALLDFAGATVTTQPQQQNVNHGATATFSVSATGVGTLTYLWRKNGVVIAPPETNSTLSIPNVMKNDIAVYDCIVSDVCGPTISDSALLSILPRIKGWQMAAPELEILKHPETADTCVGATHTLEVRAYGENLTYSWRKDGFAIVPPETNKTLVLSPVAALDAGSYDCIVSDPSSSLTSNPAVIAVLNYPTITAQPTNVNASVGDSAQFSVSATGDGELYYQWKKGGLQGPLFNIPGSVEDTHVIPSVNNGHAGRYQCAVTNFCGTVLSNTAKLTIVL